jgi:RHS repeat-associated protein
MIHGRRWFGSTAYVDDGAEPVYAHHDQIGTTRLLSQTGQDPSQSVLTAFGVPVHSAGPNDTRYGYVGAHGYENLTASSFLHVGERWYDPAFGRFLQRDPIGIEGGLNVYAYITDSPTTGIDPDGLDPLENLRDWFVNKASQAIRCLSKHADRLNDRRRDIIWKALTGSKKIAQELTQIIDRLPKTLILCPLIEDAWIPPDPNQRRNVPRA